MSGPNPFPGLRPFEAGESHLFFGREGQSAELLRLLREQRFVVVVGTSGSGKSSLARAGLLPLLHGGFMSGAGSEWRIALLRPGGDPIGNLARALATPGVLRDAVADPALEAGLNEATLRLGALGLVERVDEARLPDGHQLLVVVDQFEEIFRLQPGTGRDRFREDAAAFVKLLLEGAGQRDQPIFVLLTMRSDFLGDCARFRDLPEAINRGQYLIPRLTRDQRRLAITGPVRVGGAEITDRLIHRLLNDAGDDPDQLPILQHALMRTWDAWAQERAGPLDLEHYERIGGWQEALNRHAEEAFDSLDAPGRALAERLFRRLTERGPDNREIRRPTTVAELGAVTGAGPDDVGRVVDAFRAPGRSFLMPAAGTALGAETWIDISHESLIRNWDRLRGWVDVEADSAHVYRRLAQTAALYAQGKAALWQDPDLALALDWWQRDRPTEAWARAYDAGFAAAAGFLEASRQARDAVRRRRRRVRSAVGLGLVAAAVGFAWLWWRAERQRAAAETALRRAETAEHRAQLEALRARIGDLQSNDAILYLSQGVLTPYPEARQRATVRFYRAVAYSQQHRNDSAIAEYQRLLAHFPDDVSARNNLCHRFMQRRDYARAKPECDYVVRKAPRHFLGHLNSGMVALFERRTPDAAAALAQAVAATRHSFGSIFTDDVSPGVERVSGRRVVHLDGTEVRTALMYGHAIVQAGIAVDSFTAALDRADREPPSYNAVLYALNWAWQYHRETGDPAALAAEGALWERLDAADEAERCYRAFREAGSASGELAAWVAARRPRAAPARLAFLSLAARRLSLEAEEFRVAGRLDSALARLDAALALGTDSLDLLLRRASVWSDSLSREPGGSVRRADGAGARLRSDAELVLARAPEFADAWAHRGRVHYLKWLAQDSSAAWQDSAIQDLARAVDYDSLNGQVAWWLYNARPLGDPVYDLRLLRLTERAFPLDTNVKRHVAHVRGLVAAAAKGGSRAP